MLVNSGGFKEGARGAWAPPWPIRCDILKYHYTNINVFIKIDFIFYSK